MPTPAIRNRKAISAKARNAAKMKADNLERAAQAFPVWNDKPSPDSTLPESDRFTVVFEGDLRKIRVNPFLVDTPFGRPVAIGIGDALDAIDYSSGESS